MNFKREKKLQSVSDGVSVFLQLLGCVILGIGIWIKVDPTTIADVAKEDPQLQEFFEELHTYGYESAGAYVLIAVGSIIMVIGFLGCCGAIRESQCMLVLVTHLTHSTLTFATVLIPPHMFNIPHILIVLDSIFHFFSLNTHF